MRRIELTEALPCLPVLAVRVTSKSKDGRRVRCNCPGGWHLVSDLLGKFRELGGKGDAESVGADSGVAERLGAVGMRDVGQSAMSFMERARGLPAMTHAWQVQWARALRPHYPLGMIADLLSMSIPWVHTQCSGVTVLPCGCGRSGRHSGMCVSRQRKHDAGFPPHIVEAVRSGRGPYMTEKDLTAVDVELQEAEKASAPTVSAVPPAIVVRDPEAPVPLIRKAPKPERRPLSQPVVPFSMACMSLPDPAREAILEQRARARAGVL